METTLRLSAGQRSYLLAAMENAGRATGPDPTRIPTGRYTGESRLETLKRKAAQISRSTIYLHIE